MVVLVRYRFLGTPSALGKEQFSYPFAPTPDCAEKPWFSHVLYIRIGFALGEGNARSPEFGHVSSRIWTVRKPEFRLGLILIAFGEAVGVKRDTYHLIVRSGPQKGNSWTIAQERLVIGRDTDCDVIIADALVSRHHCEVWQTDNDVFVRDLGSRNCTLVNGRPIDSTQLNVGDEICVGNLSFILSRRLLEPQSGVSAAPTGQTQRLMESRTIYPTEATPHPLDQGLPRNISDLAHLFQVSRQFSTVESVAELLRLFEMGIRERFAPNAVWVALCSDDQLEFVERPDDQKRRAIQGVETRMRRCLADRRGSIVSRRPGAGAAPESVSGMVAPIYIGQHTIGAIEIASSPGMPDYEESDLEYLLALCHAVAPFFGSIERRRHLEQQLEQMRSEHQKTLRMVGSSEALQQLFYLIGLVAKTGQTVLILGETGTGKELVANLIHEMSDRADAPFVAVNCAAIPSELFESELFGHERGAFTGAIERKIGLFEQSRGGTILLDEIGDLSLNHQARILRVIETGQFRRVGAAEETRVDLRVLAATNRDLNTAVASGAFRSDLHYRLRVLEVRVPPLREHAEDIPELAEYFLEGARRETKRPVRGFAPKALDYLKRHDWPGNVRELKHVIDAAVVLTQGECVEAKTVKYLIGRSLPDDAPLSLAEMECRHIQNVLSYCNGNVPEAARILGIGRSTLYEKLNLQKRDY